MIAALLVAALSVQDPQDTVTLRPVVVTATRVPTPLAAVSSAVTVISGESLRVRGIRTVADALRDVPGATVVETGPYGSITSLFLRGGESDYAKVLVDGVAWNQPGGAFDFAHLTTDQIERIEVVRGPGSVLYGSDAVTGVIQIFTKRGSGPGSIDAQLVHGSGATTHSTIDVAGALGRLGYAFGASHFRAEGMYRYNNEYRNSVGSAALRFTPDARTEANLTWRYGDDRYEFPTNGAGEPVDSNQVSAARGPSVALEVARRLSAAVELRVQGALREQRTTFSDLPDSPGEDGAFTSLDRIRRAGGGASATWRPARSTILTLGTEYEEERQRGRSLFEASFGTFPDSIRVRRTNLGSYAQALLGVGRPLAVTLGARVDDNSKFGSQGTVRAGASWHIDPSTRLRGSIGTGIKEPTFFENFAAGFVTGNPNLRPERSASWEAGIEHVVPGTSLSLAATYFDQRFRDLIVYDPSRTPNYVNIAEARANGAEVQLDYVVQRGVVASVGYTYLETRVVNGGGDPTFATGKRLIRRPANALNARIRSPFGRGGTATLAVRFVGDRDDLDFSPPGAHRVPLPPYTRVDGGVEYPIRWGLTVELRADNLFDDRGREIANFPVRGRALFFGGRFTGGLTR
jgi:vitamin B12 transporter